MEHSNQLLFLKKIPALHDVPDHIVHSAFSALLFTVIALAGFVMISARKKRADKGVMPDASWTFYNAIEMGAEALYNHVKDALGVDAAKRYYPLLATLFFYILFTNIIGLVPGFTSPNTVFSTTFAMGIFVYFYYNFQGFKENGLKYLAHFAGPLPLLAPFIFSIEILSHALRSVTLGMRLKLALYVDHLVGDIFSNLAPPFTHYLVPAIFLFIALAVSLIQAFVFMTMTMNYIGAAIEHDH